jgi:hypothetical protein
MKLTEQYAELQRQYNRRMSQMVEQIELAPRMIYVRKPSLWKRFVAWWRGLKHEDR